jgi:thioredoxin-like negative regulator of GroEL
MRSLIFVALTLFATAGGVSAQTDTSKTALSKNVPSATAPSPPAPIDTVYRWLSSMDTANALASTEKKSILVSFETEWCRWCTAMRDSVWTNPAWHSLTHGLVYLRVDGDQDTALVRQYRVMRYPTVILVAVGGQEVERWIGYRTAHDLVDSVNDALEGTGTIWDLERLSQKDRTNAKILYALGRKYLERGDLEHAFDYLNRAMAADQSDAAGLQDDIMFVTAMVNRQQQNWFKSIEQLRQLLKKYPKSDWCEDAELYIPWLYAQSGDTTQALKGYSGFLEKYKSSSETQWVQHQLQKLGKDATPKP